MKELDFDITCKCGSQLKDRNDTVVMAFSCSNNECPYHYNTRTFTRIANALLEGDLVITDK